MNVFITAFVMMALSGPVVYQVVNNRRYKALADRKNRVAPFVLLSVLLLLFIGVIAGPESGVHAVVDVSLGIPPMLLLTSSLFEFKGARKLTAAFFLCIAVAAGHHVMSACSIVRPLTPYAALLISSCLGMCCGLLLLCGIAMRLRNVKDVMRSGTVWNGVCLCVDVVYVLFSMMVPVSLLMLSSIMDRTMMWHVQIGTMLIGAELVALGVRVAGDSVFVISHRHERRIVESLKISHVEAVSDAVAENAQYKEIYERVLAYFEKEKPYLDGSLTINDLVKVVFSNKLYISRAISQYTGRNFCQFVNYHRISYSIKCFRENPELKIVELASMCGFNSVVSFNMAFRLFIGENPSDWCRKERNRMLRHKK